MTNRKITMDSFDKLDQFTLKEIVTSKAKPFPPRWNRWCTESHATALRKVREMVGPSHAKNRR